jgi:1-acyl-sn-glycerol-3-phosphate acyltransferase
MKVFNLAKGIAASIALGANTLVIFCTMFPFALAKLLLPLRPVRRFTDRVLNSLVDCWITGNCAWMRAVGHTRWDIEGAQALKRKGWYLVSSNHQSWVDILVLQKIFRGKVPMLKFFLKRELIYVPVMGLAWWALDFPFLRRGGNRTKNADLETTRKSCERFKALPTSLMNFLEGTRYTRKKAAAQRSPYAHLLKPKVFGLAAALATMGDKFDCVLDVTIVYPSGVPTFWDLLCGRVGEVVVRVRQVAIPPALLTGDCARDAALRGLAVSWIEAMWHEKDRRIAELLREREGSRLALP